MLGLDYKQLKINCLSKHLFDLNLSFVDNSKRREVKKMLRGGIMITCGRKGSMEANFGLYVSYIMIHLFPPMNYSNSALREIMLIAK
jgi:hypothetical protein